MDHRVEVFAEGVYQDEPPEGVVFVRVADLRGLRDLAEGRFGVRDVLELRNYQLAVPVEVNRELLADRGVEVVVVDPVHHFEDDLRGFVLDRQVVGHLQGGYCLDLPTLTLHRHGGQVSAALVRHLDEVRELDPRQAADRPDQQKRREKHDQAVVPAVIRTHSQGLITLDICKLI